MRRAIGNRIHTRRLIARGLACILLSSFDLAIGEGPTGEANRTLPTISTNSDLVVIPVTVTDSRGRVINGLKKDDFKLYDDKVEQVITHFASDDAPVSIGLVFDTSASMAPRMDKAREAVAALLKSANPEDEFFLVRFNQKPELAVRLTTRREDIRDELAVTQANGRTALLDAVFLAMREMKSARHTRKALIIISDGEDNASRATVRELNEAVGAGDMLIYAISIVDMTPLPYSYSALNLTGAALLDEISKQTGGRLFEVSKLKQLPDIATRIGAWLRSQYVLGYPPGSSEKNGRYHRIEVKLIKPKGLPRVHTSWRLGYYAPVE